MFALGAYVLLGGQIHLPMPSRRSGGGTGVLSVYSLGIFSGIASSCCAPVLAGVIALSSVAASFWMALGLGTAYVFGMVVPLFIIALLWDRYDWRTSRLFRPKSFTWKLGSFVRTITLTNLASGILLLLIGGGMLWIGFTASSMPTLTGWQAQFAVGLQHYGQVITNALSWIPNWVGIVLFLLLLGGLSWYALRQIGAGTDSSREPPEATGANETVETEESPIVQEEPVEY